MGRNRRNPSRPRESRLLSVLSLAYEMRDDDVAQLADDILRHRAAAWRDSVETEARRYGSQLRANFPSGAELDFLRQKALEDARSIRDTYNREVRNRLSDLYGKNPRGNRNYYYKNMGSFLDERDKYKAKQIALNTEQTTKTVAREDFRRVNNIRGGRYVYAGPAPVGPICKHRFSLGVVDENTKDSEPIPAHPNCPHDWEIAELPKLPAGLGPNDLWVG